MLSHSRSEMPTLQSQSDLAVKVDATLPSFPIDQPVEPHDKIVEPLRCRPDVITVNLHARFLVVWPK
jgi:hypothetical protein